MSDNPDKQLRYRISQAMMVLELLTAIDNHDVAEQAICLHRLRATGLRIEAERGLAHQYNVRLLGEKAMAKEIGVSPRTLRRWTLNRLLPCALIEGRRWYDPYEVMATIDKLKRQGPP
jgi:hypothetical protein